jgi:hypothetical protein
MTSTQKENETIQAREERKLVPPSEAIHVNSVSSLHMTVINKDII